MQTKELSRTWEKIKNFYRSGRFWKLVGIGIIITFTGLLFGIAFMIIFQGVFLLLLTLSAFWEPANRLFGKLSFSNSADFDSLSWWKPIVIFLISLPWLLQIAAGFLILIQIGLKNQNIIYMLFLK